MEAPPIASLLPVLVIAGGMMGVVRATGPADDIPNPVKAGDRKLSHEETP